MQNEVVVYAHQLLEDKEKVPHTFIAKKPSINTD